MYTLKVNIRAQEERERREKERQTREAISKIQAASGPPAKPRKRKGLNFHEPGTFVAQGEQLRKRAKLEALQRRIAETAAKTGIADAAKLATLTTSKALVQTTATRSTNDKSINIREEEVPEVEWWDKPLVGGKQLDVIIPRLLQDNVNLEEIFLGITNLIEHPPIKDPPSQNMAVSQVPIFLTQKERKKLRRQNRRNREVEKQEKIKLGLLPKPEPKLKRSNIMYALGDQAITNPSLAEQMVKEQEEKRLKAHIDHNEAKKLSLEDKKAKKLRKIQEDLSVTGIWVSVYRILNLNKQMNKLKTVEQKAKQLTMTGAIVLHKHINLVVVEGGPKQQRKFKHLIMDRIKWSEDPSLVQDDVTHSGQPNNLANKCILVWEGQVCRKAFNFVRVKQANSEEEARKYFRDFNVEHYWDLAFKMSILESIDNI